MGGFSNQTNIKKLQWVYREKANVSCQSLNLLRKKSKWNTLWLTDKPTAFGRILIIAGYSSRALSALWRNIISKMCLCQRHNIVNWFCAYFALLVYSKRSEFRCAVALRWYIELWQTFCSYLFLFGFFGFPP